MPGIEPPVSQPAAALFDRLYADLKRVAHRHVSAGNATLQTTGLVHEAYLKLARAEVNDEAHLLNLASRAMRQVLVDLAREHAAQRNGGALRLTTLSGLADSAATDPVDVLALEQCLQRLQDIEPRLSQVVELHVYGGLSFPEMSRVLGVTERTLFRDWRLARAAIHADLQQVAS